MYKSIVFDLGGVMVDFAPRAYLVDRICNAEIEEQVYDLTFGSEEWKQLDAGLVSRFDGNQAMLRNAKAAGREFEVQGVLDDWMHILRPRRRMQELVRRLKNHGYSVYYLSNIPEIELLSISAEGRKDVNERARVINSADLAFLCLPDAASKEVMPLLRPDVKVLDTSTAFRTDAAWDYGFPELKGQKEKIKNSYRVAVPGCYASGFISIARPLVELGLAPADYPFSCTGISGYSGGGKKMIAEYESADRPAHSKLDAPKSYGLGLAHKHLPEMQKISGLAHTPMFVPVVCDYYCGMQVLVPLDLTLAGSTAEQVAEGIAAYYKDAATVKVHALNEALPENGLYSNAMAGTDRMELYMTVNAAGNQMMLVSLFDNLGKGSSGAAVQCMNLMLGLEETEGLE